MENNILYKDYYINLIMDSFIKEKHNNTLNLIFNDLDEKNFLLNNFVSSYLYNRKNILIISSESISDLYKVESIGIIKDKIINLNEMNKSNDIIDKLEKEFNELGQCTGSTLISKVNLISREINKKIDLLKEFNKILYSNDKSGISLIDKYKITIKKINKTDKLYENYRIFRIKNPLNKFSYYEVKETSSKIIESDFITKYTKYRRLKDNKYIKLIRPSIEYEQILEAFNSINFLKDNNSLSYKLVISKYTEAFIDEFNSNIDMTIEDIDNLSKKVNYKYNSYIIKKSEEKSFFSFFKKSKNYEEFNLLQNEICNEYISNYNKLNNILNKTVKMKDVLVEEEYLTLINNILRGEDIANSIHLYSKIIDLLSSLKELTIIISSLSDIENSILLYCYNNSLDKNNIQELLNNLAVMKLYYEIEEAEIKHRSILDKVNDYDNILSELKIKIEMKKNLTLDSINLVWENYLRENFNLLTKSFSIDSKALSLIPLYYLKYEPESLNLLREFPMKYDLVIISEPIYGEIKNHIHSLKSISDNLIVLSKQDNEEIDSINIFNISRSFNDINISINEDVVVSTKSYLESKGYSVFNYTMTPINTLLVKSNGKESLILFNSINTIDSIENESRLYEFNDYLINKNIRFYRVWQKNIWLNREEELRKIVKFIEE
ncbi:hypothetical protein [Clostridium tertium]|uniref:Uncharacterized protein n=1 Tax=Clostridium tertium TaxID=1559 RepID=A0A6N2YHN6_9CLOT